MIQRDCKSNTYVIQEKCLKSKNVKRELFHQCTLLPCEHFKSIMQLVQATTTTHIVVCTKKFIPHKLIVPYVIHKSGGLFSQLRQINRTKKISISFSHFDF
jgi:hypothetical protein